MNDEQPAPAEACTELGQDAPPSAASTFWTEFWLGVRWGSAFGLVLLAIAWLVYR